MAVRISSDKLPKLRKSDSCQRSKTLDISSRNRMPSKDWEIVATPESLAIDNMNPSNPGLQILQSIPVSSRIPAHSIIAVEGDGPKEEGNDGVVAYSSAHIDEAVSELVVRSSHSAQGKCTGHRRDPAHPA
jgi:hypothetical protein